MERCGRANTVVENLVLNMNTKHSRLVALAGLPVGSYLSIPTQIESACPSYPVVIPASVEHPQVITSSVGYRIYPLHPGNGSRLDLQSPHGEEIARPSDSGSMSSVFAS